MFRTRLLLFRILSIIMDVGSRDLAGVSGNCYASLGPQANLRPSDAERENDNILFVCDVALKCGHPSPALCSWPQGSSPMVFLMNVALNSPAYPQCSPWVFSLLAFWHTDSLSHRSKAGNEALCHPCCSRACFCFVLLRHCWKQNKIRGWGEPLSPNSCLHGNLQS